jgi:hypothetical protein|tara:strand:- start:6139 stop:6372 length:234 start_codon:yes stop_codon:yes gene_type:complete
MYNMKEHFDIVNNETMFGVHNKGMVLREDMYSMQQKIPQQFGNQKKLVYNYNNQNNFDTQGDISNFTSRQMGNQYGS